MYEFQNQYKLGLVYYFLGKLNFWMLKFGVGLIFILQI